ncbi:MAG: right-handed parallel beta-helix repeat-containing protein [Patescibacteria group bacterium]|jgi:hypothetical protein
MFRKIINIVLALAIVFGVNLSEFDGFGVEKAKATSALVSITVSQDKKYILNGDTSPIATNINVRNTSSVTADHVRIDLPIASGVTVNENSISNGGQFLGDKIVWLLPDIIAGSNFNLAYTFQLGVVPTAQRYYVATNGNNDWSGALPEPNIDNTDGPLASIDGARLKIRAYKAAHNGLDKPIEVNIRGGSYYFDKVVGFGETDSGTSQYPITYKNYSDEKPVFVGGNKVSAVWSPMSEGSPIYKARIEGVDWKPNNLIVNGVQATRAKDPDVGYYIANALVDPATGAEVPSVADMPKKENHAEVSNCEYIKKTDEEDTLSSSSKNLSDIRVHSYVKWTETSEPVKSVADETGIVKTYATAGGADPSIHYCYNGGYRNPDDPSKDGKIRYILENVFEKLSIEGEWYFDPPNNDLYYWPKSGEDINNLTVAVSKIPTILSLSATNYMNIEGIKFTGTQTDYKADDDTNRGVLNEIGAIVAVNSSCLKIVGNTFIGTGGNGINITAYNGMYNRVLIKKNTFENIGTTPIYIYGNLYADRTLLPNYSAIIDNKFINSGTVKTTQVIMLSNSAGSLVENNDIDTAGYIGIRGSFMNSWPPGAVLPDVTFSSNLPLTMISKNRVKNVMQKLNDGGGIYSYRARNVPISIDNNVVSDLIPTDFHYDSRTGLEGIYLDEGQSNTSITNNLVYNSLEGINTNMSGINNRVVNNILAKIVDYGFYSSYMTAAEYKNGDDGTTPQIESQKMLIKNNIVQFDESETDLTRFNMLRSMIRYSDLNLYFSNTPFDARNEFDTHLDAYAWNDYYKANVAGELSVEPNSAVADPLFVDPENNDFDLEPDSPAFDLGFEAIDTSKAGTDW